MKKVLSLVLCILLILPVFPANITFAEDADVFEVTSPKDNIISYSKKLTVSFSNEIDSSTVSPDTVKLYADGVETKLLPEDISVSANTVTINIQKYPYVKYKAEFLSGICDVNETKLGKDVLINFETNAPEKTGTIPYSNIKSAMYDFVDGSVTTEMDKYGMLRFYKVIDGKVVLRNHYYVSVDISQFAGKTVTDAKYSIHVNGRALMTFYKADGDFIPGETAYEDMPKITDNMNADDVICSYSQSSGNLNTLLDMTSYMNECLADGKTHMNFMVDQGSTSTFGIAPEQGDSSYRPFMNISYAESEFPVVTSTLPSAWETGVPCEGEFMFSLSDCAVDVSSENIILLNNENKEQLILEEESVAYDSEKKTVTLSAFEPLSPQTVYTLVISGLKTDLGKSFADKKIKFKTGGTREELYYAKPSETSFVKVNIADDYSGAVVISGKLFALSDAPVSIDVVNAEGESIYFENVTCDEYGYFSFDVSSDYSGICKAYVSSEKNLGNNIETDEFEIYSVSEFMSVWENLGSGDSLKIADSIESAFSLFEIGNGKKAVFEKRDALVEVIAASGSFGEYNYENIVAMKDFVFENYIICGFASEDDEKIVREAIEEYASEMDFASLENFGKYKAMDENSKETTAKIFSDAKSSEKDTKEKIRKLLGKCIAENELQSVFDKIKNASNYTEVTEIILDEYYADLLGLSNNDVSKYKDNKKNAGKALVGKSFDSKEEFKNAFDKAVKAESSRDNGEGSSSKGGSSVVIKVRETQSEPSERKPDPSTGDNAQKLQPSSYSFTDIADYGWASYEIEFLARMNVINGVGNGLYAPADYVTREQSAKLLVQAMELETVNQNTAFTDVDENAWYYPHISTATARGIVKGKGDSFGIGESVTREDLCTMAARALEAAGYKIDEYELSFADASSVSDYAKNAVAFLANAGVIKGMPDGTFMPKNNTTRAEAAVFMYRFCEYIKNFSGTIWEKPLESVSTLTAPTEEQILSDLKARFSSKEIKHPFIFGTPEKLAEIKNNLSLGDEYTALMYSQVKKRADGFLTTPPIAHNGAVTQSYNYVDDRIMNLMIAYYVEGDEKYLQRAKEEFDNFKKITRWDGGAQLENSQTGYALAVCYDWLYDYLTPEDRAWAEETVKVKMLEIAYKYYQNPDSYNELRSQYASMNIQCGNSTYNHSTYNNSNLFVAALALAPLNPEYSATIMANNLKNVQPYIELIGPDGGFDEPVGYYSYKSPKIMQMLQACQNALGTSYDFDRYEGFRSTSYYPLFMYGAGPFAFGDSGPGISSFDSNYMYYTAKYSKDPKLLSLVAERLTDGDCAKAILCYETGDMNNVDKDAALPLDNVIYPLTKDQNVIAMRNNWDIKRGLFAAMYAGCATANGHSDAVSGAFGIDAWGEIFATAIGRGDYDYPDYWVNSQDGGRWNWYEKRPEGSNCLVINPSEKVGQDVSETAVIDVYESGEGAAFGVTDLSGVYKEYVTSYKRGIKLHDSRSKIVVQDEATMKIPSEIFWSINTPADIEIIDEDTVLLSIGAKMVAVKFYANVDFELFEMAAEKLPTSPQKAEQLRYRDYRKIALRAKDVSELKLMAEFVPVGAYSEALLPISEFIPIENWSVSEPMRELPTLSSITLDGEALEDFDSGIRSYLVQYGTIPEKLPEVKATATSGVNVTVTYPDRERKSAEIKLEKGDEVSYYEIIFAEEEKPFDVSGMKKLTITSISATTHDGNVPQNTIDGNLNTRWSAEGFGQYIIFDLGAVKDISAMGIAYYQGSKRASYYDILVSEDGEEWTKLVSDAESSGKSDDLENFELIAKARYVKYYGYGNSQGKWNSLSEVAIYSK